MFLKLSLSPLEMGQLSENHVAFIYVSVEVDVNVPLLLTDFEVHFCLELVKNPARVVAPVEYHMDMLVFLFQ